MSVEPESKRTGVLIVHISKGRDTEDACTQRKGNVRDGGKALSASQEERSH